MANHPNRGTRPTKHQAEAIHWEPVNGTIEISIQTGLSGAALNSVIASCKRRGWIDAEGRATDAGLAALASQATP